jgi:hypothetical protein
MVVRDASHTGDVLHVGRATMRGVNARPLLEMKDRTL